MVDTAIKCSQRRQNVCWQKVLKAWNGRDPFEVLLWGQTGGPLTVYYGVHPFKTMEDLNFTSDRCSLFHKKTDVLRSKQQFLTHLLQTWHVPVQRDIELEIETGSRHRNAGVSWLCCPLGSPLSDPWPISAKSRTHYGNEHLVPYALHFYIWFVSVYNMCVCISVYVCVCVCTYDIIPLVIGLARSMTSTAWMKPFRCLWPYPVIDQWNGWSMGSHGNQFQWVEIWLCFNTTSVK